MYGFGENQLKVEDDYFINPIFSSGSNPNALFYGGKYYYTHETNDMILLWETNDITDMGSAVCKEVWRPADPKSMHNLWAPEIHRINDKWYIYYAADDGNTDNHQIYVLENDARTPMEGTFKQKGPIMTNQEWNWGIHASTFVHKGVQYLIWSGWPKRRIMEETQCIYIAKMKNPWTLDGERIMLSSPEYNWERQWVNPDGSRTAYPIYVNEAPTFLYSKDKKNLIIYYSASGCWSPYYCIGMLSCSADADLLDPKSWKKQQIRYFINLRKTVCGDQAVPHLSLLQIVQNGICFIMQEIYLMELPEKVRVEHHAYRRFHGMRIICRY